jgi:hypothetical protein
LWRKRESKRINDYIQREIDEEKRKEDLETKWTNSRE